MQRVANLEGAGRPVGEATFADLLMPLVEPGFRLALAMLHDPHAAEDVVQEASFTAWRKLGRMRDRTTLRAWFLGIVANKCRNARRTRWTSGVELGVPEGVGVVSVEERTLRAADLRRAIARLNHDDRLVVVLYFYLDMPVDEVATIAGRSVGATRARLYRSIKRLRPDLDLEEALR